MMHGHRYDYTVPYRVFAVDLEIDRKSLLTHLELKWYFYCTYCKTMFIPVRYTSEIKTLTVMSLLVHEWMNEVSIGAVFPHKFKPGGICGKGQYHIASSREHCSDWETLYLVMSNSLNVTFHQFVFGEEQTWRWIFKSVMRPVYQFYYMNTLFSFHYHGRDLLYCNFNVWSDNVDFDVWVSPFDRHVWLSWLAFMMTVVTLRFVVDLFKPGLNIGNFDILDRIVEVMLTIWAMFLGQSSNNKQISIWILVSLLFSGFVFLAQYDSYCTKST